MNMPPDIQAAADRLINYVVSERAVLSLAGQSADGRFAGVLICFPDDGGERAAQTVRLLRDLLRSKGVTDAQADAHFAARGGAR